MAEGPSAWIELVKTIPNVVTAISAVVGVWIAARGLNRWHAETIGKRKSELAEEVLADFYRAKSIFEWVRLPGSLGHEGETRKPEPGETSGETRYRNALYAPVERLTNQNEFFGAMAARRFRFKALFGPAADKPFDDLGAIQNEILIAAKWLIRTYRDQPLKEPPEKEKWETSIGWGLSDDDPIAARLDRIIADVEKLCRPYLETTSK